jgi:hypothetical protein
MSSIERRGVITALCVLLGSVVALEAATSLRLYGVSGRGQLPEAVLGTLDPETGAVIDSIGVISDAGGVPFTRIGAMAFHPLTGELFAVANSDTGNDGRVLRINPETARATAIGSTHDHHIPDATFSADGTFYGWSEAGWPGGGFDDLWTIDTETGQFSPVGLGVKFSRATGLAFTHEDSLFVKTNDTPIYFVALPNGPVTYRFDLDTGADNALEFDEEGTGYTIVPDGPDWNLATIDWSTGQVTPRGASGVPLSAISFRPEPVLPVTSATANAAVLITANLRGKPNPVTLFYREGGGTSWLSAPMTETPAGSRQWQATIPAGSVTRRGIQYYVEADFAGNVVTVPRGAPTTAVQSVSVNLANELVVSLSPSVYQMAGIPFRASNSSPTSVFDELGDYVTSVWRYGTWNAAANAYDEPPSAGSASPGQGFWIIAKDAANILTNGRSTDLAENFRLTLQEGFNQIANPFAFPVAVSDLVIPAGVEQNFISYGSTGYIAGNTSLSPGTGYWVMNNGPGIKVIQVPPRSSPTPSPSPRAPGRPAEGEAGWCIHALASVGSLVDSDNRFGFRSGATAVRDPFDFSDPPLPPGGYATLSFVDGNGERLLTDYRAATASGTRWEMVFESDQRNRAFRIDFEAEREPPAGWRVVAFEGKGSVRVDLLETGGLTGTVTRDRFERTWTIAAGPPEYLAAVREELQSSVTAFSLGAPFPNPASSRDRMTVELEVPGRTDVLVQVYDIGGRLVRTLVDETRERGAHRIEWDGADRDGRRVGAGVYFVQVRAGDFETTRKVVRLR